VYGTLEANKVAGNFHFAPGKSFQQANMHVHDLMAFGKDSFNVSHKINEISFGVHFPGVVNPLDKYDPFFSHFILPMYQWCRNIRYIGGAALFIALIGYVKKTHQTCGC